MFQHVKVNQFIVNSALLIEFSCPKSGSSARQYAPQGNIRYECEHVTAGFDAELDDPVTNSYTTRNCYERKKADV